MLQIMLTPLKMQKMKFDLSTIFEKFDAIITPAAPGEAPRDYQQLGMLCLMDIGL